MTAPDNENRYAPPQAVVADMMGARSPSGLLLASRTQRFYAAMIDCLIGIGLIGVMALVTPWNLFKSNQGGLWEPQPQSALLGFVIFLLVHGYLLASRGQTVGKLLLGLRIVRTDGSTAGFGRLIGVRYGVMSLCQVIPAVGQLAAVVDCLSIFRANRRCLHDNMADTIVIKQ